MKKILIPTDFSEKSVNTVKYGIHLGQSMNKAVTLVYVVDLSRYTTDYHETTGVAPYVPDLLQLKEVAETQFKEFVPKIKKEFGEDVALDTRLETGIFADRIIELSNGDEYDLILLTGRTEKSFLDRLISDRNETIIEDARCPVFIVPPSSAYSELQRIVYATNYNEADIGSLQRLSDLARIFNSKITALHISNDKSFKNKLSEKGFEEMVQEKCNYTNINLQMRKGDDIVDTIEQVATELKADLIGILKENHGFWKELFSSSSTKELVLNTKLPVLVFHEKSFLKKKSST